MLKLNTLLIASLFSVLPTNAKGFGPCGNTYCQDDEVCETNVDGGICFKKTSKIVCNSIYHCYKPETCCGFDKCCPEHSTCCDYMCCLEDSYCDDGECVTKRPKFNGWYGGFAILPLIVIIAVIIRCRRVATLVRVSQRRVVTTVPAQSRNNQYGYDQGPIVLGFPETSVANTGRPSDANDSPPAYNEVVKPQAKDV